MKKVLIIASFLFVALSVTAIGFIKNTQQSLKKQNHSKLIEVMNKLDANKDSKISDKEAIGPLKEKFTKIDANGDGYLTMEELENAPVPTRKRRA